MTAYNTFMPLQEALRARSIPALDGLRAIFVVVVILCHAGMTYSPAGHGVEGFFVLSGFLITWLLLQEEAATGSISLRSFYARRALRLFPAFYTFWFIYGALVFVVRHEFPIRQYISSFFYVSNYYIAIVRPEHMAMEHTWSLAIEEQFYALWPMLFLLLRSQRRRMAGLAVFIAASAVYRIVLVANGVPFDWMYFAFDTRASQLGTGCLMAVVLHSRKYDSFFQALTSRTWYSIAVFLLLCCSIVGSSIGGNLGYVYGFGLAFTLDPFLIALWVCQTVALSQSRTWSWLNSAPFRYVGGKLSYSMYLYHWLIAAALVHTNLPVVWKGIFSVAGCIVVSACSYHLVELPFLRMKKRFTPEATHAAASRAA